MLGEEIKVLNHGIIKLLDVMGSDAAIVDAARVSYGEGTSHKSSDRQLIRYLMRHHHTSPFEMCEMKFFVKMPIFVARQWVRHRTASINEYSARYSVMKDEVYSPEKERILGQAVQNKQGSEGEIFDVHKDVWLNGLNAKAEAAFYEYDRALSYGISRETARIGLPLSTYTQWYWKIDLHNLLNFLRLRMDPHAQWEIRVYAEKIAELVQKFFPLTWEAFRDYRLNAVTFSAPEQRALQAGLSVNSDKLNAYFSENDFSANEQKEMYQKLNKIFTKGS